MNREFWKHKRVCLTGHTGFKGGWLAVWLSSMEAQVLGYALKPEAEPSFFSQCALDQYTTSIIGDILHVDEFKETMCRFQPEVVFHLAAQAIVRQSYQQPRETFLTNVMGTVSVLEMVRCCPSVRAVIIVTSDKCYENKEWTWGYREIDALGGHDPYSASKACAELVTASYCRSFFDSGSHGLGIATVRAGNVIGGGDWSRDRIVPDAMRVVPYGEPLVIRNPTATRPWQHALEPLAGYLTLAERLYSEGERWAGAWNFGPRDEDAIPVATLADMIIKEWGMGSWIPVDERTSAHEAQYLKLDCSKAHQVLGWRPQLSLEEEVALTVAWYRKALDLAPGVDMYDFTVEQIRNYEARLKGLYT